MVGPLESHSTLPINMSLPYCHSSLFSSSPSLPVSKEASSVAMNSLFPAGILPEPFTGVPFPSFETTFTPWDYNLELELPVSQPTPEPATADSSKELVQNRVSSSPNDRKTTAAAAAAAVSIVDERKQRRMISNRQSARRSRMRKQEHLENLRNQANRLRIVNRQLTNILGFALDHCYRVRTDNHRLMSERTMLQQKLVYAVQVMLLQQHHQYSMHAVIDPSRPL
ncbi:hypothetical protein SAY86_005102 [Trapa natans]|uniref:BZIP domain-containing protein n=1 Tax=Trapa natans TaxID=22666 RepID=A0AAN7L2V9_TRANT|nr:hypothetical protein SAY86_005102 [Trapa natans]